MNIYDWTDVSSYCLEHDIRYTGDECPMDALEAENERLWDSAVNMGCDCGSFGYPDPREHDENCWYVWFAQDVAARRQKAALKEADGE